MPVIFSLLLCSLLLSTPLLAADTDTGQPMVLRAYQAIYAAKYNGMPIEAQRQLAKLEQGYRLDVTAKNFLGNMRETETIHLDSEGRIRIDGYISKRSFFGNKRTEKLAIDHQLNKAVYTRKNKKREIVLLPEHLGPVSYQLQLRRDLFKPNTALDYSVIAHGKIKHYRFERAGEDTIVTGLGTFTAQKVRRLRQEKDRETVFWMARELAYLPVKIWQREDNGETYEMTLKSVVFEQD
ncbi:hypothetical protein A9Q89_03360 [Gammaproteobacteria bacterium 53_120_T64]|nr:hypothetical protein A9Q89_03360 [Gammaproteobacteria bacterium 53_120_T64]